MIYYQIDKIFLSTA